MKKIIRFFRKIFPSKKNAETKTSPATSKQIQDHENDFHKISDKELENLRKKAESCIDSKEFQKALFSYDLLIKNELPHPHYFKRRAFCHRMLKDFEKAIEDYDMALALDLDDSVSYWSRGACYNDKAFLNGIEKKERDENLYKALIDYKSSIEKDPVSQEAWLALLDIDLWLHKYDDAISHYGACKPYIKSQEYLLIRAWYGCIALILAGDSIEEEDDKLFYDNSIRLKWYHWAVFAMDIFFNELEQMGTNPEKIQKAKEIHNIFMNHFDDEPFNPLI